MFKFSLETVLKQRKIREEQAARRVVEARQARARAEAELARLRETLRRVEGENREHQAAGLPAAESELCRLREVNLLQQIEEGRRRLSACEKAFEEAEKQLLKCIQDRRLLEKVREHHWEAYKQEADRRERQALDEVAAIRAAASRTR